MANSEKTLQIRVQEKIDTLANWQKIWATFVPLAGEKIIFQVPADTSFGEGDAHAVAQTISKTGNGTTTLQNLPWDSALAADVYDWAKATSKPSYTISEITGRKELSISGAGTKVVSYDGDTADSLNIVGEGLITVTPDATNNKITIKTTANNYSLPAAGTSLGGVKTGGVATISNGEITAISKAANATTADEASKTTGSLTIEDANGNDAVVFNGGTNKALKVKSANNRLTITATDGELTFTDNYTYSLPVATSSVLGGVKSSTSSVSVDSTSGVMTVNAVKSGATGTTADIGDNSTKLATTAFVANEIANKLAANDAMIFKGTLGTGGTVTALPDAHEAGWTYRVITAGTYAGIKCEVGDLIICITDGTAANNAHWTVAQTNIDGAVTGPASATNNGIALFNGTTGKIIKNSSKTIVTSITGSANVPTDAAVKSYVDDTVAANTITANATDDDIVDITATGGVNTVTITGAHAKKGPSNGYTSGNTTTSLSGAGQSATIKIPQLTVDAYGHVTAAADESITITLPEDQVIPTLSGGLAAASKQVISGITVSGHTVTPAAKTLTAGSNISITDADNKITIANTYTLPAATSSARGGIKIGYTASGANLPVQLSSEKAYVALTKTAITTGLGYTPQPEMALFSTTASGYTNAGGNANNILFGDNTWAGATDYIILCAGSSTVNI